MQKAELCEMGIGTALHNALHILFISMAYEYLLSGSDMFPL